MLAYVERYGSENYASVRGMSLRRFARIHEAVADIIKRENDSSKPTATTNRR